MIAQQLLQTGILQLGLFIENGISKPYRLHLEMLPAYPHLMQQIVYRTVQTLSTAQLFDRLVAPLDAIPVASTVALNTGISLVYSRGQNEAPVHDLVGAYDVGHPSCLITNTITSDLHQFIWRCQSVGLKIHTIIEIVSTGATVTEYQHHAVYTLQALIHELQQHNAITPQIAHTVHAEFQKNE